MDAATDTAINSVLAGDIFRDDRRFPCRRRRDPGRTPL